jgi:type IV secretory pathway VirB4 component
VRDALAARNPALATDLEPFVDGLYAPAFAGPTNVDLTRPFVVFDVSKTDDRLRPVAIAAITAHIWREARRAKRPRLLIVDEAASVLQTAEGARFLGEVARRARKHYLGLCVAVQKLSHLDESPAGRDVLQNAAAKLILSHREADTREVQRVVGVFDLSEAEKTDLLAADKGEGLLLGRGARRTVRILASEAEHELITTRRRMPDPSRVDPCGVWRVPGAGRSRVGLRGAGASGGG